MNKKLIVPVLREFSHALRHEYDPFLLQEEEFRFPQNENLNIDELIYHLIDAGQHIKLVLTQNSLPFEKVKDLITTPEFPILLFLKKEEQIYPVLFYATKKGKRIVRTFSEETEADVKATFPIEEELYKDKEGDIVFLTGFPFKSIVSLEESQDQEISPVKRLFNLLDTEKKDIFYIYVYAIAIGIISLALPLGTQAIVSFIAGGMWFNSVILLIGLVIIAILISGGLQIMQVSMVEVLQRRIFAKAAFEFAYRTPKINSEALLHHHTPELMNRFFDVLTIQKGLPKLLIDLSTAILQIFFSLVLLSFYHPFFVFFGLVLIGILVVIFYVTGPKGLHSSIAESKYKYKVVYWLEELARIVNSFKVAGNTHLPIRKTDINVNNYLTYRKKHFKILIRQFSYIVLFKTFIIGGLLIIGTVLVIDRQITLGQFVASEIIIVLIFAAVEKIIVNLDTVYDMLTAVDKIGHVTDLPLEREGGFKTPRHYFDKGIDISIVNLSYSFPGSKKKALNNINLHIKAGEKLCVSGYYNSGKTTLVNVLDGIYPSYEGIITMNNFSLRDLDLTFLRDHIAKNVSHEEIFDGTILDNILVGKPYASYEVAIEAIKAVGMEEKIYSMEKGLYTELVSGGKTLSSGMANKLILARCIAKKPKVMILNTVFQAFEKIEKIKLINYLTDKSHDWTLVIVTNDPVVMQACERVIVMKEGEIVSDGSPESLAHDRHFKEVGFSN